MIRTWRLASSRYEPLSGEGARLVGGRWNSPGVPMIYTSSSLALCLAESLVHITGPFPLDYVSVRIAIAADKLGTIEDSQLDQGWQSRRAETRRIGDGWAARGESLALEVPSAVLPESTNVLINPLHADIGTVRIEEVTPFRFDPRLRT